MSDEPGNARSDGGTEPPERPSGLPEVKSEARMRTPVPESKAGESRAGESKAEDGRVSLRPRRDETPAKVTESRPPGLLNMTTSVRRRLMLVLDDDERASQPPPADPSAPPKLPPRAEAPLGLDASERTILRSLARWVAFTGLMTLTVGALTGLSYFTGTGTVAHVVVGILACALAFWLLGAALSFRRVGNPKPSMRPRHHMIAGFGLLRSALLLKAVLLFAALALSCVTFSLAGSLLFLL